MCPRCKSTEVTRSRSRKLLDPFLRWLGMKPYRCRECHKRFYLPASMESKHKRERAWRHSVEAGHNRADRKPETSTEINSLT
jgi:hypothetical protein